MRIFLPIWTILLISTSALCAPKQLAELTASDGTENDNFGYAVAMSGNTVVVGAPNATVDGNVEQGKAYVFVKPESGWGNMTQVAELAPSNGSEYMSFGVSVAISGDTIIVGTEEINENSIVYVFVKPAGGWKDMTETFQLVGGKLETFVAIDGNTIVVASGGIVQVYVAAKGGWAHGAQSSYTLTASDGTSGDDFGSSVAVSGETVVVGADSFNNGLGAAYVFVKPAGGWTNMTQTATLTPSNGGDGDNFGISVSIDSSTIVVGAPVDSPDSPPQTAYVFVQPAGGWTNMTETAQLQGTGSDEEDFGRSVAVLGNRIVVGNPFAIQGQTFQGESYIFTKPKTGWQTTSQFSAALSASDDKGVNDQFGISVAMSGARIVIGTDKDPISPALPTSSEDAERLSKRAAALQIPCAPRVLSLH
jgi:hypothetical protein